MSEEEGRRRDEELDRQALLAEQRREEERLLQEEQQREKMERIRAVEGETDGGGSVGGGRGEGLKICGCYFLSDPFHVIESKQFVQALLRPERKTLTIFQ